MVTIVEDDAFKICRSEDYNYDFRKTDGYFRRWGKFMADDPQWSPYGPEIMDMSISTICSGLGKPCSFCYQSNGPEGKHITFEQFKMLFSKLPSTVNQIAYGLGDTPSIDGSRGNPDTFKIFDYTREHGVIPNCTVNGFGLDNETAEKLAQVCGAVAVSRYDPPDVCYNAVKKLTSHGLKQVNIHTLVSEETYQDDMQVLYDVQVDKRLKELNAIVFLSAKKKGRGKWLTPLSLEKYQCLIDTAFAKGIRIGFDSCSCHKFLGCIEGMPNEAMLRVVSESCESGLFSIYSDINGIIYPCSFSVGEPGIKGINLLEVDDFMEEVWDSETLNEWRSRLLGNNRNCPLFDV